MTTKPAGHADVVRALGRLCHEVREHEPLRKHVSFRIGGLADLLVVPRSREELRAVASWLFAERAPFAVLGQGSNVLISDQGIRGIVLKIGKGLDRATLGYAYRTSVLQQRTAIVVEATLQLQRSTPDVVKRRTDEWLAHRAATQPIGPPSSGCIFRNPAGDHAGRLIDLAGGKGLQVGGAQVSEVHANYIVNTGAASAADVVALMHKVNALVAEKFGVELEPEIKLLGEFEPA